MSEFFPGFIFLLKRGVSLLAQGLSLFLCLSLLCPQLNYPSTFQEKGKRSPGLMKWVRDADVVVRVSGVQEGFLNK